MSTRLLPLLAALGAGALPPAAGPIAGPPAVAGSPTPAQARDSFLLAARSKGSASAPITVFEMSDFQCPYCRRHALETFPELERDYVATGKVRWVFVNFPLTQIHANAAPAAELAMCAAKLGRFWPMHDILFKHQRVWAPLKEPGPFFLSLADSIGLPRGAIQRCVERGETRRLVRADAEGAARSGASSTPTFYIEGGLLPGAAPAPVFRRILDSLYVVKTHARTPAPSKTPARR
ncbi:MAG TPA: DsbA family protein [Gemmatimonadales bacterium]|nr:DsbA family protein [Gemmatimonadales bacterium]